MKKYICPKCGETPKISSGMDSHVTISCCNFIIQEYLIFPWIRAWSKWKKICREFKKESK